MKQFIVTIGIVATSLTNCINAQCNTKVTHRDDGVTMEYFTPKPVIKTSTYEVGTSIYKNRTTGNLLLNVSILFKTLKPQNFTGNIIIHTNSNSGIKLAPIVTDLMKMNGRDVALGLFLITKRDYELLKSSKLKGFYFNLDGDLKGDTVTENSSLLNEQLKCLKL